MWSCGSRTLGEDMLAARCLMLNSYLIDRYFSVHLTTNIGDVKVVDQCSLWMNGRRGGDFFFIFSVSVAFEPLDGGPYAAFTVNILVPLKIV